MWELFDTARNPSLCTWFVYDHPIAELTGFLALNAALKERARQEGLQRAEERSFGRLIKKAIGAHAHSNAFEFAHLIQSTVSVLSSSSFSPSA